MELNRARDNDRAAITKHSIREKRRVSDEETGGAAFLLFICRWRSVVQGCAREKVILARGWGDERGVY